ncbi:MAG: ATP-binding protein [Myxococcota bacterium]
MRGPSSRHWLLGLALLAAIQCFFAWEAFVHIGNRNEDSFRAPLPDKIAALVATLEALSSTQEADFLRAIQTGEYRVWIDTKAPDGSADDPRRSVRPAKAMLDFYLSELGGREVRAWIDAPPGRVQELPRIEQLRLWSPFPLQIAIQLRDGRWLKIESKGFHAQDVLGFPPGLVASVLGIGVAGLALVVLWRALEPLKVLSDAAKRFSATRVVQALKPQGPQEVRELTRAVNVMQDALAGYIEERQLMFSAMSHDLRTFLTRLRLRVEKITDRSMREKAIHDLEAMGAVIEDGLLLARLDRDTEHLAFDVVELVAGVTSSQLPPVPMIGPAQTDASFEIRGHRGFFQRAIENLLANARAHGREPVTVELTVEASWIQIDVLDRGDGIEPDDRERLRRPFERGAASRATSGAGLGLAIVDRILSTHEGSLELMPRTGGGTIARLKVYRSRAT